MSKRVDDAYDSEPAFLSGLESESEYEYEYESESESEPTVRQSLCDFAKEAAEAIESEDHIKLAEVQVSMLFMQVESGRFNRVEAILWRKLVCDISIASLKSKAEHEKKVVSALERIEALLKAMVNGVPGGETEQKAKASYEECLEGFDTTCNVDTGEIYHDWKADHVFKVTLPEKASCECPECLACLDGEGSQK